jgi:hypothetical protein
MPPFVPSATAQTAATLAGNNQANLAAPVTGLQASIAAGNLAPAAFVDAILATYTPLTPPLQDIHQPGTDSIVSTAYVNFFGSWTFNAPVAKTYLLHIDVTCWASVLGLGSRATATFQLIVDGVAVPLNNGTACIDMISTINFSSGSWRVPIALTSGFHTVWMQVKVNSGATVSNSGNGARVFTVTG